MTAPAIHIEGAARIDGVPLFANLSLSVAAGEWTAILGASGVGKSTILRLIAALDAHVAFDGAVRASDEAPLTGRIAYMAQADLLFPWATVTANVALGARLRGEAPDRARIADLIRRVGLTEHAAKKPAQLSGGQRQRAALARTLMEDRPIILLDEPFSALDAKTRAEMQELAAHLLAGRTVLLVTHDPAEAARLGHHIHIMDPGGLTAVPAPDTPPVRAIDDPASLACRTELYRQLRGQPA